MLRDKILILIGRGSLCGAVYKSLRREFGLAAEILVVVEDPPSRIRMIKRRMERLGVFRALGQVLFSTLVVPVLSRLHRARIEDIQRTHGLNGLNLGPEAIYVQSINDRAVMEVLQEFSPDVVVVFGTRIIKRDVLQHAHCPILNTHMGITPAYRGVHGGYWALADGRPDLVGTTVHRVDEGIDTGDIIEQVRVEITENDSFVTYPYLQLAAGLPALLRAVRAALSGTLKSLPPPELESSLRYHPTLWGYLQTRMLRGVK